MSAPSRCHRHDQEIDRPRADGAAARHRDPRLAHAGDQRRDHPEARAHFRDQLVGRGGVDDAGGRNVQRLAVIGGLAGALAARHDVDAVIAEDALKQRHVGEPRHVVEDQRLLGQQRRDHQRQRGVLRARDRDGAVERPAADDANAIHNYPHWAWRGPTPGSDCGESRDLRLPLWHLSPGESSPCCARASARARACSLRRLRFSRNAADSRSLRAAHFCRFAGFGHRTCRFAIWRQIPCAKHPPMARIAAFFSAYSRRRRPKARPLP